jgi:ATP adenylyltransferase
MTRDQRDCIFDNSQLPPQISDLWQLMERLHSYWRMEYVEALRYPDHENPFLALPKLENDREAFIVHRGPLAYLMLNRFPYNAGHLLAVPYREVADLQDLSPPEMTDLMRCVVLAQTVLREILSPDGFNIGFNIGADAGASIAQHLHCHIVPRWRKDTNFMPVLADTRVLPKSLDSLWEALEAACSRASTTD